MFDRFSDYERLRSQHPRLIYERFTVRPEPDGVEIEFEFLLEPSFCFRPTVRIETKCPVSCPPELLENLAFHIGLIELLSYWKSACPPELLIRAGSLAPAQQAWWKQVYFHGLGEFFHRNGLHPHMDDFVSLIVEGPSRGPFPLPLTDHALIPVGGGKDSLVSLDLLRESHETNRLFFLNPTRAQWASAEVMGYSRAQILVAQRRIDPLLLQLNRDGYLNGHTPFSALLAFIAVTVAALDGRGRVVLSNERTAEEPTVPGTEINHQWSKTWAFEKMFHDYIQDHLLPNMEYFSVLRPWCELQIARRFCEPHHQRARKVFRSCNVGQKTDSWCGHCPKCLFVNIMLGPFVSRDEIRELFSGAEPLSDPSLLPVMDQLSGAAASKPFECVGSVEEVRAAMSLMSKQEAPPLLVAEYSSRYPEWIMAAPDIARLVNRVCVHSIRSSFFS